VTSLNIGQHLIISFKSQLIFSLLAFCSFCFAQEKIDPEIKSRCNQIGAEVSAAYVANDMEALRRLSIWRIESCKNFMTRDDYFSDFGNLAVAERELGNFNKALKVAQDCIKNRYGLPMCHIEEYFALKLLGQKARASRSGSKFYNIVRNEITATEKILSNSTVGQAQFDLSKAKLELYESMLGAYLGSLGSDSEKNK
jgi:hypothetical protein